VPLHCSDDKATVSTSRTISRLDLHPSFARALALYSLAVLSPIRIVVAITG